MRNEAKAGAGEAHLIGDGCENLLMRKNMGKDDYLSPPSQESREQIVKRPDW